MHRMFCNTINVLHTLRGEPKHAMPTSVRLDPKTEAVLRRIARRTGRTKSDILRDAILRMARRQDVEPGNSFLDLIGHLVGIGVGGPPDLARRSEQVFKERLRERQSGSR